MRILRYLTRRLPRTKQTTAIVQGFLKRFPRPRPTEVGAEVLGFSMRLDPSQYVDLALLLFPHFYDAEELTYMREHLRPADTFLDLGAYVGLYALSASRLVGSSGRVVAVEPEPTSYRRLCLHLEENRVLNVEALNVGVSDQSERRRLAEGPPGFRAATSFFGDSSEGIEVECLALLKILTDRHVMRVRGAKLDIEGFEYRVLRRFFQDAPAMLHPEFLIIERHPHLTEKAGGDVIELAQRSGYQVVGSQALNWIMVRS